MTDRDVVLPIVIGIGMLAVTAAAMLVFIQHNDSVADEAAIGRAMACVIAKHPGAGYTAELATRRIGQRMARQLLVDLKAKGASPDLARLSITATVCEGLPDQEPLPLVPE